MVSASRTNMLFFCAQEFETELKQATEDIEDKEKAKLKDDGDKTQ